MYTGIAWFGRGEHQHTSSAVADYVSLGPLSLEECFLYCLEYDGCLANTDNYSLVHTECVLYFPTVICQDYHGGTEECLDLYPFSNMNVITANDAYNAYVFDASNFNGFVLSRTRTDGYLTSTRPPRKLPS